MYVILWVIVWVHYFCISC